MFEKERNGLSICMSADKMNNLCDKSRHPTSHYLLVALCLTVATIATYWQVLENQFIAYDDQLYVTENPHVVCGLSWQAIYWALTSFYAANWHPVTWFSHQLDITLFGLNPGAHHAMNLLLHTTNTILLYSFLTRLTGTLWRSTVIAAVFALHPLHVESVAWLAERKDLLCAFFFFLTLHAYLNYVRQPRWAYSLLVTICFTLSLMAKPMSVTLPFVLLLLDWWPLQRIHITTRRTIILEKTPLLLLSGVSCIVTLFAQQSGGAIIKTNNLNISDRLLNALTSYMSYLWELAWPHNLALFYPLPVAPSFRTAVLGTIVITSVTIISITLRKRHPYLLTGWFWYLGMLVPVIGLVQVGLQSHADRYMYLPLIGCSVVVVWGLHELSGYWRYGPWLLTLSTAGLLLMFASQTQNQLLVWHDSETLFRHSIAVTSGNYVMHVNLGIELQNHNNFADAMREFRKAIAIRPQYADPHFFLANAQLIRGNAEEAAAEYYTTLRLRPDYPHAHTNRGMALQQIGSTREAINEYRAGLNVDPDDYKARENLTYLLHY